MADGTVTTSGPCVNCLQIIVLAIWADKFNAKLW